MDDITGACEGRRGRGEGQSPLPKKHDGDSKDKGELDFEEENMVIVSKIKEKLRTMRLE